MFLEAAEERGVVGEAELETLAFEHDLDDDEIAAVRAELAVREVEIASDERAESAEPVAEPQPRPGPVQARPSGRRTRSPSS